MKEELNRREFLKATSILAMSGILMPSITNAFSLNKPFFEISLAQWSLHKSMFSGKLKNKEFPLKAKNDFGIDIVEYVSVFFQGQETDKNYLKDLRNLTKENGIQNHLIMVDGEGDLGDLNKTQRTKAVENHYKWVDAAKMLGCKTIRVNANGKGSANDVKDAVIEGLGKLTEYGAKAKINVIVENHGGYSSNGAWLASVMAGVNNPYCGTLPDFGNFKISEDETYDLYKGVEELLPYAKGISAKTFRFNEKGDEPDIDYFRLFNMIKKSGFKGVVGIEWEGNQLDEDKGILATKQLLERVQQQLR